MINFGQAHLWPCSTLCVCVCREKRVSSINCNHTEQIQLKLIENIDARLTDFSVATEQASKYLLCCYRLHILTFPSGSRSNLQKKNVDDKPQPYLLGLSF